RRRKGRIERARRRHGRCAQSRPIRGPCRGAAAARAHPRGGQSFLAGRPDQGGLRHGVEAAGRAAGELHGAGDHARQDDPRLLQRRPGVEPGSFRAAGLARVSAGAGVRWLVYRVERARRAAGKDRRRAVKGYGLIETMRVRDGRIPFLERHLARLARSLGELGLPKPSQAVAALVRPFAETGDAVLRVEVRDGRASVTVRELPRLEPPAVITASEPHQPYPHKTTERDCFADAGREAEVAEADDALLLTHEGCVAEGTVWTVSCWERDGPRTPALDLGILPGIARARVLELVKRVEQGRYPEQALRGKSLFLTN